ncbi:MAG: dTDP-4-dehydrorhamnose 3,5-epimerase [Gammaproteobacteria bacterium]|nr:dTDP-4-dehydrorhamnose 3,5-epimerase [Gammaproteobacteria bacterium]
MRFVPVDLADAMRVQIEPREDERGFFARTVCAREFTAQGLPARFVQSSISWTRLRGTVRGLHFQWPPSNEDKLVRCLRGAIHDVLLDLRPGSPSYLRHVAVRLDAQNREAVFVPSGVAHGFQTLEDDCEVLYQMSDYHAPTLGAGVRWNDANFGIDWPITDAVTLGARDAAYPDFERDTFEAELARRRASAT